MSYIPLTALLLVIYNGLLFSGNIARVEAAMLTIGLPSGATWVLSLGDLLIMLGLVILYIETLKATRTGSSSLVDHGLSMGVFILFLVEFLVVPGCGTSLFLILALIALIDVVSGFSVSIVAARRDLALDRG